MFELELRFAPRKPGTLAHRRSPVPARQCQRLRRHYRHCRFLGTATRRSEEGTSCCSPRRHLAAADARITAAAGFRSTRRQLRGVDCVIVGDMQLRNGPWLASDDAAGRCGRYPAFTENRPPTLRRMCGHRRQARPRRPDRQINAIVSKALLLRGHRSQQRCRAPCRPLGVDRAVPGRPPCRPYAASAALINSHAVILP